MKRLWIAVAVCCAFAFGVSAQAADYPAKPIRMVVSFVPGGGSDISGRILADGLHQALGRTIVVDNRAG